MRRWLLVFSVACLAVVSRAGPAAGQDGPVAFTNVTVIDVEAGKTRPGQTVLVEGAKITAAGPSADVKVPAGARAVDGAGKFLIPGLWDMHVHLADPGFLPLFVANGVTGIREMHAFYPASILQYRQNVRDGKLLGPRFVAAGALVDGKQAFWPGALKAATPDEGREAVRKLKAMRADFVKVYESLPRDVYFAVIDEAKKQGLPFAGHVPQALRAAEASDAGQRSIEHLTGVLLGGAKDEEALQKELLDHLAQAERLNTGLMGRVSARAVDGHDAAKAQALYARFAKNETWQTPTLVVLRMLALGNDPSLTNDPRVKYMSVFMKNFWKKNDRPTSAEAREGLKRVYRHQVQQVKAMHQAGVPILAGTDAANPYCFPGFSLHDELALLVEAGLTPADALRTATWNPAKFLGETATAGSVAAGKRADLVLLDADPLADIRNTTKIRAVVVNGRLLPFEELQKLLADAEKAAGGK